MIIEKAQTKDLPALSNLFNQLIGQESDAAKMPAVLAKIAQNSLYHLLVARDAAGQAIGTAMGIICYDLVLDCKPFMLIENVVVSHACRGQNVGKNLLNVLEKIAKANHCTYIMLVSEDSAARQPAHKFYAALGYHKEAGFKKKLEYNS